MPSLSTLLSSLEASRWTSADLSAALAGAFTMAFFRFIVVNIVHSVRFGQSER